MIAETHLQTSKKKILNQNEPGELVGGVVKCGPGQNDRNGIVNVPEVARAFPEFNRYFIFTSELRLYIHDAALAFFLREAID